MPATFPDPLEASRRFGQVFLSLLNRSWDARRLRTLSEVGFTHAETHIERESFTSISHFLTEPDSDQVFVDREATLERLGGLEGMVESETSRQLTQYRLSIDSAAMVFTHSALDATASELCWITAFSSREDWEPYLDRKKVSIGDLRDLGPEAVINNKLEVHLRYLEREPLLKRVDQLFTLCRPGEDFVGVEHFRFDRDRLESLDGLRHDIVHNDIDPSRLDTVEEDIEFLTQTGAYLWALVNYRYGVRVDPEHLTQGITE